MGLHPNYFNGQQVMSVTTPRKRGVIVGTDVDTDANLITYRVQDADGKAQWWDADDLVPNVPDERIVDDYAHVRLGDRYGVPSDPEPHTSGLACWCQPYMSPSAGLPAPRDGVRLIVHRNSRERAAATQLADINAWVRAGGTLD